MPGVHCNVHAMHALALIYRTAVDTGADSVTVWYRPALHFNTRAPPILIPLYFWHGRKQLFCFRNCAMAAYLQQAAAAVSALAPHAAYVYAGSDGDTYVLHLEAGMHEETEHRPKFDYSGAPKHPVQQLAVSLAPARILAALADTASRRQYTSIICRARAWSAHGQGLDLVVGLGAAALAPLPAHVLVCTTGGSTGSTAGSTTRLLSLPGLCDVSGIGSGSGGDVHNDIPVTWRRLTVHPAHQRFIHPAAAVKTLSSSGDCLFSALAYACAHSGNASLVALIDSFGADATTGLRLYLAMGATPAFLAEHYCDGSVSALRTWLTDGSVYESGVVDAVADAALARRTAGKSAAEVYAAILAYKCSNAYWGRDFEVQMFERLTGVGVLVFASPAYFGSTVDILGRKPNGPYGHYVLLYNDGNVHFEAVSVLAVSVPVGVHTPTPDYVPTRVSGFAAAALPPWLAYIVSQSLCVNATAC
jgi:hypothetical protein